MLYPPSIVPFNPTANTFSTLVLTCNGTFPVLSLCSHTTAPSTPFNRLTTTSPPCSSNSTKTSFLPSASVISITSRSLTTPSNPTQNLFRPLTASHACTAPPSALAIHPSPSA